LAGDDDSGGKDLYAVLGLARGATDEEIRVAFRNLAVENHPDKHPEDAKAALRFKRLNAAYQVLRDPEKKDQYDQLTAPIEDFGEALARPVAPASVPPRAYEPEVRYRRRRVRRTVWSGWKLFVGALLSVSVVMLGLSMILDHHGSEASDVPAASPTLSRAPPQAQAPVAPTTAVALADDHPIRTMPGLPRAIDPAIPGAPLVSAGNDFNGRAVAGPGWQFSVPEGWQESGGRDEKGAIWQAPADVGGLRPNVKLVIKALTGDPPEYFKELDRKLPRGVAVDSEAWEYETKPDGLRREGRVALESAGQARFVQFAVVEHGKAYELTCTGPDDAPGTQAMCEPILESLRVK
jgi:hypothetical protein